jgi:hypothetical protein
MQSHEPTPQIDWTKTTFEGARREQLRRWSQLSLQEILQAQEEMQNLAKWLHAAPNAQPDNKPR